MLVGPTARKSRKTVPMVVAALALIPAASWAATDAAGISFGSQDDPDRVITNQYADQGVLFTSSVHTQYDSVDSWPVLAGDKLRGAIAGRFVAAGSTITSPVTSFGFDIGYIDTPNTVRVLAFDAAGAQLSVTNAATAVGYNKVTVTGGAIASFRIESPAAPPELPNGDPGGFAIDNFVVGPYVPAGGGGTPTTPTTTTPTPTVPTPTVPTPTTPGGGGGGGGGGETPTPTTPTSTTPGGGQTPGDGGTSTTPTPTTPGSTTTTPTTTTAALPAGRGESTSGPLTLVGTTKANQRLLGRAKSVRMGCITNVKATCVVVARARIGTRIVTLNARGVTTAKKSLKLTLRVPGRDIRLLRNTLKEKSVTFKVAVKAGAKGYKSAEAVLRFKLLKAK